MTCIVGFTDKKNNVTWIGADSLGSNGYTQDVESNPKVFRNTTLKNVVMGSTSTFRHIDLLKYSKTLFPEIDKYKIPSGETKVNHEYMVTTFVPNIITLFENGIKDSGDKGGCAVFNENDVAVCYHLFDGFGSCRYTSFVVHNFFRDTNNHK